mgnify:CR=1 FL=1
MFYQKGQKITVFTTSCVQNFRHLLSVAQKAQKKEEAPPAGIPLLHTFCRYLILNYLRLTSAPSPSSLALISSASALDAASLITFGALSTNSFASFSPRPVTSRTTLITLTLEEPADTNSTSNSSFSSAAAPASAPAAATTTPAAADTPNSSSHAFTSHLILILIIL